MRLLEFVGELPAEFAVLAGYAGEQMAIINSGCILRRVNGGTQDGVADLTACEFCNRCKRVELTCCD